MNFGTNLQNLRKKHDLSQEQLAEKLEVSRQAVSKWENGSSYPEMDKLIILSELFNVDIDMLVRGDFNIKNDEEGKELYEKIWTGYIYIPLLGRWLLPLIWGIFWGISICLLSRLKLKITPVSLLLLVVNGGIIWYLWKTSYEISSYHLMMVGGTLAAVLVLALQRLRQKEKQK